MCYVLYNYSLWYLKNCWCLALQNRYWNRLVNRQFHFMAIGMLENPIHKDKIIPKFIGTKKSTIYVMPRSHATTDPVPFWAPQDFLPVRPSEKARMALRQFCSRGHSRQRVLHGLTRLYTYGTEPGNVMWLGHYSGGSYSAFSYNYLSMKLGWLNETWTLFQFRYLSHMKQKTYVQSHKESVIHIFVDILIWLCLTA